MTSSLPETVFTPPHRALRLAQTRYRLLPGLVFLSVFVFLGVALSPFANLSAGADLRGAQIITRDVKGALAIATPQPIGAQVIAGSRTQPSTSHPPTAYIPRQRRVGSSQASAEQSDGASPSSPSSPSSSSTNSGGSPDSPASAATSASGGSVSSAASGATGAVSDTVDVGASALDTITGLL